MLLLWSGVRWQSFHLLGCWADLCSNMWSCRCHFLLFLHLMNIVSSEERRLPKGNPLKAEWPKWVALPWSLFLSLPMLCPIGPPWKSSGVQWMVARPPLWEVLLLREPEQLVTTSFCVVSKKESYFQKTVCCLWYRNPDSRVHCGATWLSWFWRKTRNACVAPCSLGCLCEPEHIFLCSSKNDLKIFLHSKPHFWQGRGGYSKYEIFRMAWNIQKY